MTPTAPRDESFDTRCVHAAHAPDAATGALAAPIQLATTFERDADGGYSRGFRYGREGTPNRTALEACVAELEGGLAAVAFSSGLAANLAVLEQLNSGDRVVAADIGYHGTHRQLREIVARRGVSVAFVDTTDLGAVAGAVDGRTRLLWLETPANPLLTISDLAALTTLAHAHGARVVCDSTFATPYCQRPFAFGVDVVIHSGTKYFGGHSDVLSGFAVIGRDRALAEQILEWQRLAGAVLAPFDCWLLRRSISTLGIRMQRQCFRARACRFPVPASQGRARPLSGSARPSRPRHRRTADDRWLRRDDVGVRARRTGSGDAHCRADPSLSPRDQPRWRGEPGRASRLDRGTRFADAGQPAAALDRNRGRGGPAC